MKSCFTADAQRSQRILIVFLCVLCASAVESLSPTAFADTPIALADYRRVVTDTLSLIENAIAQTDFSARVPLLIAAASDLSSVRLVQLDSGEQVAINNDALSADIRAQTIGAAASAEKLQAIRARLQALLASLNTAPPQASADDDAKLRDLLSKPPFKLEEQQPSELERLINEWLSRLFGATARGILNAGDVIVVLGFVLIAAVLVFFVVNLRRNAVSEVMLQTHSRDDEAHLTSSAALDHAQHFATAGDYRAAVRQLYLSTLLWLDEHGQLRYDRSLTNREYLRAVANTPSVRAALQPIVDTFDHIWYGFAPINATEFAEYQRAVDAIRSL